MIDTYSVYHLLSVLILSGIAIATTGFAVWAWRTFDISVLLWVIIVRVSAVCAMMTSFLPDSARMQEAVRRLNESGQNPKQILAALLMLPWNGGLVLVLLVAAAEILHAGPKLNPAFCPQRIFSGLHALRHVFGALAVLAPWVPHILVWWYLRSLP